MISRFGMRLLPAVLLPLLLFLVARGDSNPETATQPETHTSKDSTPTTSSGQTVLLTVRRVQPEGFVVFQALLGTDGATHLAFVLSSRTKEISHVKLVDMTDGSIQAWPPNRLVPCDVQPRMAPDVVVSV